MSEAAHHWKNVWIIGASSGIGRELAIQLAPVSEQVFISARSEEKLAAVAAQASNTTPVPLDINDHDAVKNICDEFVNSMGGLDLVVISSGIWKPAKLPDLNLDDFKLGMETNYLSVVHILSCLLPSLVVAGKGHVALVASVAGYRGLPNAGAYAPTKAALINLAECLRPQLKRMGITLSLVNPGFVETPMTSVNKFPMPFLMQPEAAADVIIEGLKRRKYEIAFPRKLVFPLKIARILPNRVFFWLVDKFMLR